MNTVEFRIREGSVSDIHIAQCDCEVCDGSGRLCGEFEGAWQVLTECPHCEGLGYQDVTPESEMAYQAYLTDLYRDVVRTMPLPRPAARQRQPAAA